MTRSPLRWLLSGALVLSSASALAQSHHHGERGHGERHHADRHHAERHADRHEGRHHHDASARGASSERSHAYRHRASSRVAASPELVPQDLADVVSALQRMRVYAARAPDGVTDFSAHGRGTQFWFVLPNCASPAPNLPGDACPVDRIEIEAVGGTGAVHPGLTTTLLAGASPRRVRAFAVAGAPLVRVQLVGPSNDVRYEAVADAARFAELPLAAGRATPQGFALDLARYPAR